MSRKIRSAFRRRGRDVITGLMALTVAGAAITALLIHTGAAGEGPPPIADAARVQIERAHLLSEGALRLQDGERYKVGELRSTLVAMDRTHHGMRYGDDGLGLGSVQDPGLERMLDELDPVYLELHSSVTALVDDTAEPYEAARVVGASEAYRTHMTSIESVALRLAADRLNRARRLELMALGVVFVIAAGLLVLGPFARKRRTVGGANARLVRSEGSIDHLTGLAKRSALRDHLVTVLGEADGGSGSCALLCLDIDDVSAINQVHGRGTGDRILQEVAHRVRTVVRGSDFVARLGGDQFGIVVDGARRREDADRVAEKILEALEEPIVVDGDAHGVTAGIGVAIGPVDADRADDLLDKAMVALHSAKQLGKGSFQHYSVGSTPRTEHQVHLLDALRTALRTGDQLWLAYQPKVDLRTGEPVGVEALIRWSHPHLGGLLPERFIPLAEESEAILEIGRFVLDQACRQAATWSRSSFGPIPVSVNVSARQLRNGDLADVVGAALDRYGLDPGLLEIELTEGVLMEDSDLALEAIAGLRGVGVKISVDDFGTGFSSLSYLKRFPIDTLKIDRSFINELSDGSEDAAISTAIIALAHSLDLTVVAEGAETESQLRVLQSLGCDIVQGFIISRPMPAASIDRFWRARPTVHAGTVRA